MAKIIHIPSGDKIWTDVVMAEAEAGKEYDMINSKITNDNFADLPLEIQLIIENHLDSIHVGEDLSFSGLLSVCNNRVYCLPCHIAICKL